MSLKQEVGLKILLQEGLSELEFYGDVIYKFKGVLVILILGRLQKDCKCLQNHE